MPGLLYRSSLIRKRGFRWGSTYTRYSPKVSILWYKEMVNNGKSSRRNWNLMLTGAPLSFFQVFWNRFYIKMPRAPSPLYPVCFWFYTTVRWFFLRENMDYLQVWFQLKGCSVQGFQPLRPQWVQWLSLLSGQDFFLHWHCLLCSTESPAPVLRTGYFLCLCRRRSVKTM